MTAELSYTTLPSLFLGQIQHDGKSLFTAPPRWNRFSLQSAAWVAMNELASGEKYIIHFKGGGGVELKKKKKKKKHPYTYTSDRRFFVPPLPCVS